MTQSKARRAFTLVELCVVLGILALLAAVLVPVLSASRARARQIVCASNLSQLYLAFALYASNNDGNLPTYHTYMGDYYAPVNMDSSILLVGCLQPYTHTTDIWFCPEDPFAHTNSPDGWWHTSSPDGCLHHAQTSYQDAMGTGFSTLSWWPGHVVPLDGVYHGRYRDLVPANRTLLQDDEYGGCLGEHEQFSPIYSHNGRANVLFCDGHMSTWIYFQPSSTQPY